MILNQVFNCTITFIINGEKYVLSQNPNTAITIESERSIESVKTPDGGFVTYGTNLHTPYVLSFEAINVNKAVGSLLRKTWEENMKNNMDYRFAVIFQGNNHINEQVKIIYNTCVLSVVPMQTELGQELAVIKITINAKEQVWE